MGKLIQGKGINDADYQVTISKHLGCYNKKGKKKYSIVWECPYYTKWRNMLKRCYSTSYHRNNPTYKNCTVCEEWLTFSNFRKWMVTQVWENSHLDKDLIIQNNRIYSSEACVFVASKVNTFLSSSDSIRGDYLLGVSLNKGGGGFISQCCNPLLTRGGLINPYIGTYSTELEAHLVWKKRKHEYACQLANSEYVTDERIHDILIQKYSSYHIVEDWCK